MAVPHPLPTDLAEFLAGRLRALGDPLRIRLVDLLRDGDASVQELADRSPTTQQNVSKHLGTLYRADIVSRRVEGRQARYALRDERTTFAILEHALSPLRSYDSE